jgi:uncharacterized protein (TIGR02453 family)
MSQGDRFDGFADDDGKFFKALAKNQKREWFAKHKDEFETGWHAPMKSLLAEVREGLDKAYRYCDLDEPKVFRIFRDVRFSKDKSPYKTHIGGHLAIVRKGKAPEVPMALYLHVGVGQRFAAAGHYMMDAPSLARFRAAVVDKDRGKELDRIVARLRKSRFTTGAHETLKRVPKGFDADHPRAELLKMKGLVVTFPTIPRGVLTARKLLPWLVGMGKQAAPLVEWLVFATA